MGFRQLNSLVRDGPKSYIRLKMQSDEDENMNQDKQDIKEYWEDRAVNHRDDLSATTNDVWLRKLEVALLKEQLAIQSGEVDSVIDVGCGDGYTIFELAKTFPEMTFTGIDYSEEMIRNAKRRQSNEEERVQDRTKFQVEDIRDLSDNIGTYDIAISDRCLINLSSVEQQQKALESIYSLLENNGRYLMIENFEEGHERFNDLRERLEVNKIPIRWHNNYFTEEIIYQLLDNNFKIIDEKKFASTYYLVTRVLFSKLCQLEGKEPPYDHPIYEIAFELDAVGDYAPMRFYSLEK